MKATVPSRASLSCSTTAKKDVARALLFLFRSLGFVMAITFAPPIAADPFTYVKLGSMNVDGPQKDHPLNLALSVGYELDSYVADFSVAAEVNRTIDDGEYRNGGDIEFESNGLFFIYKSTRSLFVVGRVGYVENKTIIRGHTSRDDGIALGGGIGVVIGQTRLHLEFVSYAGDANHISLGLQF